MRYIDADKIEYRETKRIYDGYDSEGSEYYKHEPIAYKSDIDEIPTADVVEVRHGEWITKCIASSSSGFEWYMHTCSNCGDFYKTVLPDGYKYCHNCGAKMDGERKDDGT